MGFSKPVHYSLIKFKLLALFGAFGGGNAVVLTAITILRENKCDLS